jgi:hypothetical protein
MTASNADRQDFLGTGFTYISERMPYTQYGNWCVVVCAAMAVMGLVVERMV